MRRSRAAVAAAGCAAGLVLTGCSGEAEAGAEPGWEPSLTPSVAPDWPPDSVLDVAEPSAPRHDGPATKAQAVEYVGYLFDEVDYALRTTYVDRSLRVGECALCDYVVDLTDRAREQRLSYEFDDWDGRVVRAEQVPPLDPRDTTTYWRLDVTVWEPEVRTLDESGDVVNTVPASHRETTVVVGRWEGSWRLLHWWQDDPGLSSDA